jgi:hypothetical protein
VQVQPSSRTGLVGGISGAVRREARAFFVVFRGARSGRSSRRVVASAWSRALGRSTVWTPAAGHLSCHGAHRTWLVRCIGEISGSRTCLPCHTATGEGSRTRGVMSVRVKWLSIGPFHLPRHYPVTRAPAGPGAGVGWGIR